MKPMKTVLALGAVLSQSVPAIADPVGSVAMAVNTFQNGEATHGAALTVDAAGPVAISEAVELPGFAFQVYDVDVTGNSLTMTLVADLGRLMITSYDDTTFDRYYFSFDQPIEMATLSDATDAGFAASVEVMEPGTSLSTAGAFVEGLPTEFTFENGGIMITVGAGTDLTVIAANGGSLTVDF